MNRTRIKGEILPWRKPKTAPGGLTRTLPTNLLAVLVAMVLTMCAFFAMCQIMGWAVMWYMVAAAIVVGFFVAFAAMFGFDKFRQTLEQITHLDK